MNLSHLVLALFIILHKTLFAFVLFSGRGRGVIRSGISRIFPATMQKAAPGSSGAACRAYFSGQAHFFRLSPSCQNGACRQIRTWASALRCARTWGRCSTYTAGRGSCRCTSCGACWRACRSGLQSPCQR